MYIIYLQFEIKQIIVMIKDAVAVIMEAVKKNDPRSHLFGMYSASLVDRALYTRQMLGNAEIQHNY